MLKQLLIESALRAQQKSMKVDENYNVEDYLKRIPEYFDSEKAKDRRMTVVYEFHDSQHNDGVWTVSIAEGKCTLTKGEPESFDTRVYMTAETYRRILTGQLDFSRVAYSVGAIRFFGNSLGHSELNSYLTFPKKAGIAAL